MFDVAEVSPLTVTPIETKGKYIFEVADDVRRQLRSAGLEPEWLNAANFMDDDNEAMYGPKSSRQWPQIGPRERLAVSVQRGRCEGWVVFVDRVGYTGDAPNLVTVGQKLLIGKVLTERQAWDTVRAISKLFDVA
ncbi:conserved hypothetical protein [Cupriavidus taiwanensis]|uniref:Uncharacterized protein n=2 Tax=Cupriavidus TaxID=106589 RepID=A0A375F746_9BURK|nr:MULTISPECIES: hypothetical protein [Cupriavidus]MCO4865767.1 hypothetical protein [Cupriavidus sp. WGlv3]ULX56078.1 hypothetical protein A9P79_29385 [Cupriavidus taiwanensis]SOY74030.1 conserved hypothetical protein [Cupriavidus taiwanensis]SOY74118.1 conserved hypothetical protein [Cupriavidus taiwanensis]SOY77126.1 conserved hypothetical protein [Cupriavidus taiwanensis]